MDDLFEQLRDAPPVNKNFKAPWYPPFKEEPSNTDKESFHHRSFPMICPELMDDAFISTKVATAKECKIKQCKILLSRMDFTRLLAEEFANQRPNGNTKTILTKAEQKLYDAPSLSKKPTPPPGHPKVQRCLVRIQRHNLEKLRDEFNSRNRFSASPQEGLLRAQKSKQRRHTNGQEDVATTSMSSISHPRRLAVGAKKSPTFNVKIGTKKDAKPYVSSTHGLSRITRRSLPSEFNWTTPTSVKTTKFTRSHLIHNFGKRFLSSYVRIERCSHPQMQCIESQRFERWNKGKSLSVSFKEQVEVFGFSDSNDSANVSDKVCGSSSGETSPVLAATETVDTLPVEPQTPPATFKSTTNYVEIISDCELEPCLLLETANVIHDQLICSTPVVSTEEGSAAQTSNRITIDETLTLSQFEGANAATPSPVLQRTDVVDADVNADVHQKEAEPGYVDADVDAAQAKVKCSTSFNSDSVDSFTSATSFPVNDGPCTMVTTREDGQLVADLKQKEANAEGSEGVAKVDAVNCVVAERENTITPPLALTEHESPNDDNINPVTFVCNAVVHREATPLSAQIDVDNVTSGQGSDADKVSETAFPISDEDIPLTLCMESGDQEDDDLEIVAQHTTMPFDDLKEDTLTANLTQENYSLPSTPTGPRAMVVSPISVIIPEAIIIDN